MSKSIAPTLGGRIAARREEFGWKQKDLAEKSKLSITFISEVENDKRALGSESLLNLAEALSVSVDFILKGEDAKQPIAEPLVIPPELAEAAEQMNWSLSDARDLHKARGIKVARRSRTSKGDDATRTFSKQDWINFYKDFFEDE
jgi:transcriptional regulator with XRE-family HTH domain